MTPILPENTKGAATGGVPRSGNLDVASGEGVSVANDGTSSMSGMGMTIASGTGAASRQRGLPVRDTAVGTVITAEIPAVPIGPSYGVLLPDGSVWYPGSRKRLPAPLILRVVVWILAFAIFIAGAGDFVIRYHPTWVAALRHIVPAESAPAATGPNASTSTTTSPGSKGKGTTPSALTLITPQPAGLPAGTTAYTVDSSAYTVTVTAGTIRAWVEALPSSNGQPVDISPQQQTLDPRHLLRINQTTSAEFIHIGANGTTIRVFHGVTLLAKVPTPARCPCYVLLEPTGH
jgi:hypothetical protein